MPTLTLNELSDAIFQERVKGLAIDTSIYEQYQFGLEVGLLATLQQFQSSSVRLILPDVIEHEVRQHMRSSATLERSHVKNALKPLGGAWGTTSSQREEVLAQLFQGKSPEDIVDERVAAFAKRTGALSLSCGDFATMDEVLHLYLNTEAPFADREGKKNEFPDAIALCALQRWAENEDGLVLAVSKDGDWVNFADQSPNVCVLSDLPRALASFQANRLGLQKLLLTTFGGDHWAALEAPLFTSLNTETDNIDAMLDAASSYSYDAELIEVQILSAPGNENVLENAEVVSLEDGVMEVSLVLTCNVEARFSVSFQVWDGIDREYVGMGSNEVLMMEPHDLDVLLTFQLDNGAATFVAATPQAATLSFETGEVEPDWRD